MQREFGKRSVERAPRQGAAPPALAPAQPATRGPFPVRALLAIGLTVAIVGGMFLLPRLAQCEGGRGVLGLDWCRLMKASVEGGARGLAVGRGTMPAGGR